MPQLLVAKLGFSHHQSKVQILENVSGIIKPSRITLLLGPPGCGKTTLLKALAGRLNKSLTETGEIEYNGVKLDEFVPAKTSAYVSQYDLHVADMTVRETLDFSARFQGVGSRAEIMKEVIKMEKEAGITPDPDIDAYMKIMGLDKCADVKVGNAMRRGISGGEMKRLTTEGHNTRFYSPNVSQNTNLKEIPAELAKWSLNNSKHYLVLFGLRPSTMSCRIVTTVGPNFSTQLDFLMGEMIVGPCKVLLMDEISTGLDSSTTFQIVSCLQQLAHISEYTILVSLLQPAPETYDLFDDIILMGEGKVVYHGPKNLIMTFFESCGFKCPERKGPADFLQEVLSKKDQQQYWSRSEQWYNFITVDQFCDKFKASQVGQSLAEDLSKLYEKSKANKNALSCSIYSLSKWHLLKACFDRELLLMKRNAFLHITKAVQLGLLAIITGTVFFRTHKNFDIVSANYYMGSLFYALILLMVNGIPELVMSISRLPVFYKHRDHYLYPGWAYAIPAFILKIPASLVAALSWTSISYYLIGYTPEAPRYFRQLLVLFLVHTGALSLYRCVGSYCQTIAVGPIAATMSLLVILLFGGFLIPQPSMPNWLKWGFWLSPLSYAEIGLTGNEFLAPRWLKITISGVTIGRRILIDRGLDFSVYFYWISVAALIGFILLYNIGFAIGLTIKQSPGASQAIISNDKIRICHGRDQEKSKDIKIGMRRMALPFTPLTISFRDVNYYVDTPPEMRKKGYMGRKLQLLRNITGAFQPGILSALMGVTGAGKTTLLDVLAGRKTGGVIEGDIRIGGYPKVQQTFSRISGYCEQNDVHSPQITVGESVAYSAWLRLPAEIDTKTRKEFVDEVLEIIELEEIRDALVGTPGVNGLSREQRKRLTIAVELVSNPSIVFMDEPTSGLDARAAAIAMRAVKNVAETGRTVVCTIHQPSIEIFEAFDELMLIKRGGELIYAGPLGQHSCKVIQYFQRGQTSGCDIPNFSRRFDVQHRLFTANHKKNLHLRGHPTPPYSLPWGKFYRPNEIGVSIPGVPKIKDNYNPSTWMLEVASTSMEAQLGVDFAQIYTGSSICKDKDELIKGFSMPPPGTSDLHFPTRFPQKFLEQFKACLWKQFLSHWRTPSYNLVRIVFMAFSSIIFGVLYWQQGNIRHINDQQGLFTILGCMYGITIFTGINNSQSAMPFVAVERSVMYRERFAGMYSPWAYSFAQVAMEIPYVLMLALLFMLIAYPTIGYAWTAAKFCWFFYTMFWTLLYFVYFGMLIVSITPNLQVASIYASSFYMTQHLLSGFVVPPSQIPKWWIWLYYISPMSWTLNLLFTTQFGFEDSSNILVFGETKPIAAFVRDYFGFHRELLPLSAIILAAYPVLFAILYGYSISRFNFQKR
uniref:ABC transporter domain-containing protein n=1 Tax=Oryza meridionalis TaxID=40149 RepID=A0A0E0F6P0_9ORYZ